MPPVFFVRLFIGNNLIDGPPFGQAAQIVVVDVDVGKDLGRGSLFVRKHVADRFVGIDAVELQPPFPAEIHRFVEELAVAGGPKNQLVAVGLKLKQGLYRKRLLAPDCRIFVFDDSTVEIDCYDHPLFLFSVAVTIAITITIAIAVAVTVTITISVFVITTIALCSAIEEQAE